MFVQAISFHDRQVGLSGEHKPDTIKVSNRWAKRAHYTATWTQRILIFEVGARDDGRRRRLDERLGTGLGPHPDQPVVHLPPNKMRRV